MLLATIDMFANFVVEWIDAPLQLQ